MFPLFLFALRSFLAPKKERYKIIPSQYYSFLIFVFVSFSPSICFAKLVQEKSINQSINQSIIYYLFSKEKTIINKYNEIKLNKTNKTLRNNLAYYLL